MNLAILICGPAKMICVFQCVRLHSSYLIFLAKDSLSLIPIDFDRLKKTVQTKQIPVGTMKIPDADLVLSGSTDELQALYENVRERQPSI
jgi:hypothetical protein